MRFRTFSPKQKQVLCWWCEGSPYASHMAILCDGAVRSGKTICMGLSFFAWLCYRFHGQAFAVCGKTIRSVKRKKARRIRRAFRLKLAAAAAKTPAGTGTA